VFIVNEDEHFVGRGQHKALFTNLCYVLIVISYVLYLIFMAAQHCITRVMIFFSTNQLWSCAFGFWTMSLGSGLKVLVLLLVLNI